MDKFFLISLMVFSLSGCATENNLKNYLQAQEGKDIDDLISQKGHIPEKSYTLKNNDKIYCFKNSSQAVQPGILGGGMIAIWCDICYRADKNGKIKSSTYRGNRCIK